MAVQIAGHHELWKYHLTTTKRRLDLVWNPTVLRPLSAAALARAWQLHHTMKLEIAARVLAMRMLKYYEIFQ